MKVIKILSLLLLIFVSISCSSKRDKTNVSTDSKSKTEKKSQGKDDITIKTDDGKNLSAYYYYYEGKKDYLQPVIILIHQFTLSKDQWPQDFIESLLKNNYKVLTYDMRGHGESSKVEYDLSNLLSDPKEAPKDVDAIFKWAKSQKGVDSTRIAVIGTSIGGNLACYGRYHGAKVAVAISNSKEGFLALNSIDERMMRLTPKISNVLLICGSKDGQHEQDQKDIYDNWLSEPREKKVYDSGKHGKYLLDEHPEIYSVITDWLKKYL